MSKRRTAVLVMGASLVVCGLAFGQKPRTNTASGSESRIATAPAGTPASVRSAILQQLPAPMRVRIDKPVADRATATFLTARARSFRVGSLAVPLAIDTSTIIDVGAESAGESRFISAIDLGQSPELVASIKRGTGSDSATAHVTAVLASQVIPVKGSPKYRDTLFVAVMQKDLKRVQLWRVENGAYKRVVEGGPSSHKPSTLANLHAPTVGSVVSNTNISVAAITVAPGNAFSFIKQELGAVCEADQGCISDHCSVSALIGAPVPSTTTQIGGGSVYVGQGTSTPPPRRCVPAAGTGELNGFCQQNDQCKSQFCSESQICAPPKKAFGATCTEGSECKSNTCSGGKCVPADGSEKAGEYCTASSQCKAGWCYIAVPPSSATGGPGYCMPADGTGKPGEPCLTATQCTSKNCVKNKCDAPKKAPGQPCTSSADCASGVCSTPFVPPSTTVSQTQSPPPPSMCVPADGTGNLGDYCTSPGQCVSQTCTSQKCVQRPLTMYDAYGTSFFCSQYYCSPEPCQTCCAGWTTGEMNLLAAGAIACHSAASIWPWAHVYCLIVEAQAFASIEYLGSSCQSGCSNWYPRTAQNNPNSCPLTR
jgi:hypothetical protein